MAWLTGWRKRRAFIIPSNRVGATLTHFPILLKLSSSSGINSTDITSIFDEVGANYLKIAVTKNDGVSQLYVEVDKWDSGSELAWLWVSHSTLSLSPSIDDIFYIYYDNNQSDNTTYVGLTRSTPAESVWDNSFKLVCHMSDNPDTDHVRDSSINKNDGTKVSTNNPLERTSGIIGDDQNFSTDYITIPDHTSLVMYDQVTLECWCYLNDNTADQKMLGRTGDPPLTGYLLGVDATALKSEMWATDGNYQLHAGTVPILKNTILAASWQTDGSYFGYIDGTQIGYVSSPNPLTTKAGPVRIGVAPWDTGFAFVDGVLDEIRISDTARSIQWLNACHDTGMDDFVRWNEESFYARNGMLFQDTEPDFLQSGNNFSSPLNVTVTFWMIPVTVSGTNPIIGYHPRWEILLVDGIIQHKLFYFNSTLDSLTTFVPYSLYHVACTRADTNIVNIYVNGSFEATDDNHRGTPATNLLEIASRTGLTEYYDGYLEDVRIYNRVLAAPEIQTIYACKGSDSITYGLIDRWLLNEGPIGTDATGALGSLLVKDIGIYKLDMNTLNTPTYQGTMIRSRSVQ